MKIRLRVRYIRLEVLNKIYPNGLCKKYYEKFSYRLIAASLGNIQYMLNDNSFWRHVEYC